MKQRLEQLYLDRHETADAVHSLTVGEIAVFSASSPLPDAANEDAAAVIEVDRGTAVLAVADGLGGQPDGQRASGLALKSLRDAITEVEDGEDLREAILSGFERANQAVISLGTGAATTLAVAEIHDRAVRTFHTGDSGIVVFGGRGKVTLQTISHSPVGYAVEAGVLDEHMAMAHEDRHVVSNVVGDPAMHVTMGSRLRLKRRDTVVVASDGLFDNLFVGEIVERLRKGALAQSMASLVHECRKRMDDSSGDQPGKPDDLTVVSFRRSS
ncbi:MAG: PP2C family protein-serine/threonine phosphatase [Gammaproteobacteria bacterium]